MVAQFTVAFLAEPNLNRAMMPARKIEFSPACCSISFRGWFCGATIIFIALVLRLPTILSGLPYIDYIDEGYVLHQSINLMNRRSADPGWYGYPSLPAYLTAAAVVTYSPVYYLIHGHGFGRDLPSEKESHPQSWSNYDLIAPPALIVSGRFVTLCLSLGTVALTGFLGLLLGGEGAMLLAMLFAATSPALVSRGTNVIVDTFATFFVLGALSFAAAILRERSDREVTRNSALAGAAAGLAFACKYTVVGVLGAALVSILVRAESYSQRLRLGLVVCGACLVSGLLATPSVWLHPLEVLREVMTTAHSYTIATSRPGYFGQAVSRIELGWPLALAGLAGLFFMLRSREHRPVALGWIVFAASLFALFLAKPFQPFRNLLPLVPTLCIAAAILFAAIIRNRSGRRRSTYGSAVILLMVIAIVTASGFNSLRFAQARFAHRDSRIQAIDWLQKHTGKDDRVLGIAELGILPAEWQRVGARITVAPLSAAPEVLAREQFEYVVAGKFAPSSGRRLGRQASWMTTESAFVRRASFGRGPVLIEPYLWHTSDEQILIFARRRE